MAFIKEFHNKKGISYQVNIRKEGYKPIYKTFKGDKAEQRAKKWAKTVESQMDLGIYKEFSDNNYQINTVEELIDYFDINVARQRYAHYEKYIVMFNWWKDKIGKIKLKELTTSILTSCKNILINEKIKKGDKEITRKPNTINKYLMCMSAILTYAVNELEILEVNPMSKVKTLKKPNGRTKFLNDEEINQFALKCKNHSLRTLLFFTLLLKTGGRFNEVRHLQVKDIDRQNLRVYYLDTKNNTHRGVHIDSYTLSLIDKHLEDEHIESGYIFKSSKTTAELADMKGVLEKIIKDELGWEDFHIHDIRHTSASILAESGASLLEIAEILGQKSLTVARLYSHLTKKHTEKVLASVMDKYRF